MENIEQCNTTPLTSDERERVARTLYTPLAPWETRLLALNHGQLNDELTADLHVAVMTFQEGLGLSSEDRNVTYEALSYTWGDPIFPEYLVCNGKRLSITKNLAEALRHLRNASEKRYIWVDAICINQFDTIEKARQIRNLFVILQKAKGVIAWLGHAGLHTDGAITWAKEARKALEIEHRITPQYVMPVFKPRSYPYVHSDDTFQGLIDVICRPWTRRAWVVQEVFAASTISIHCGSSSMALEDLLFIARAIAAHQDTLGLEHAYDQHLTIQEHPLQATVNLPTIPATPNTLLAIAAVKYIGNIRCSDPNAKLEYYRTSTDRDKADRLVKVLDEATHLRATDDRDRVIALLVLSGVSTSYSLREACSSRMVCIDYNLTTAEFYQDVSKYIMNSCQNLRVLYAQFSWRYAADHGDLQPIPYLPSWTPDFRMLGKTFTTWDRSAPGWIDQDRAELNILRLTGYVIGKVSAADLSLSMVGQDWADVRVNHGRFRCVYQELVEDTRVSKQWPFFPPKWVRDALNKQEELSNGLAWTVSGECEVGDILVSVVGGFQPLVLRRHQTRSVYECIGYAEIHVSTESSLGFPALSHVWECNIIRSWAGNIGESVEDFEIR